MYKIDRSRFGKGLFATRRITKGTIITKLKIGIPFHFQDTLVMGDKESHSLQIGPEEYVMCPTPFLFSNHSCDPNAGLNSDFHMIALRDIPAGDEICWDYSTSMLERHWEWFAIAGPRSAEAWCVISICYPCTCNRAIFKCRSFCLSSRISC